MSLNNPNNRNTQSAVNKDLDFIKEISCHLEDNNLSDAKDLLKDWEDELRSIKWGEDGSQ